MSKKLTITLDEPVYEGLMRVAGRGKISRYIESLIRPHVTDPSLEAGYRRMAEDEAHEAEALEWSEGLIGDVADEPR